MPTAFTYDRQGLDETPTAHQTRLETATGYYTTALSENFTQGDIFIDDPDTATTSMLDRPQAELLAERLEPGDTVVIPDTSVAFASTNDLLATVGKLTRARVFVALLDIGTSNVSPDDKKTFDVMISHMEAEYRRRCEQARRGVKARKLNAPHRGGHAPYGYRWRGKGDRRLLVPSPVDRHQMGVMVDLRATGLSLEKVAREMMLRRFKNSRTGREWTKSSVERALQAETELREQERTQPQRQCSSCHKFLAATTEFFHSNTNNDDGLHTECRACRSTKRRGARKNNRDQAAVEAFERVSRIAEHGDTLSKEDRLTLAGIVRAFGSERKLGKEIKRLYDAAPAGSPQQAAMLFKVLEMAGV